MRLPPTRRTMLALLLGMLPVACVSPSAKSWALIQRTTWELVSIEGNAPIAGSSVQLHLEGGRRLFGNGGVNEFFGSFLRKGAEFTTTRIAMTRRAGPGDLILQERRFVTLLEQADGIEASPNRLVLLHADEPTLEFVPAKGTRLD